MRLRSSRTHILILLTLCILLAPVLVARGDEEPILGDPATGPVIGSLRVQTAGPIEKYAKFEVAFDISDTTATNPYFPYDPAAPAGVESGSGISVDALLLPPGETDWNRAKALPCFYYQPVEERGSGAGIGLVPVGPGAWRFRCTPERGGTWQYRVRATDAGGTGESAVQQFTCIDSTRKGFIRVSSTDPRFFEFANGEPFLAPLVNLEEGSPFASLAQIRANLAQMGHNGVRFVRWFPTGEGANYYVLPFGDSLHMSWGFGNTESKADYVDSALGNRFSYAPYYYSAQEVPALPGATYRLSFRALVLGEQVLRAQVGGVSLDICSASSTYHQSVGGTCGARNSGWEDYSLVIPNASASTLNVALRGLYVSTDAPAPFNAVQPGAIRVSAIKFQRDETGQGGWGANLLARGDPDTYRYVDQLGASRLDEVLRLSEQYGVYHKLTLFHKNDAVLNRFQADGSIGNWAQCDWGACPNNFYSAEGQAARWYERAYTRYFVARWSYSPALHSLELANENDLSAASYQAGYAVAQEVQRLSSRHLLMSNSFWGWWVNDFWSDPAQGSLLDYADVHWYADHSGAGCDGVCRLISNLWNDSAAYVREAAREFGNYARSAGYAKPIVRGEGGVTLSGTAPQDPDVARDPRGTYYHKKVWAGVGTLGYSCDGDWYPRLFVSGGAYPNSTYDPFKVYAAYERFVRGEPLANGHYEPIGSDLSAPQQVVLSEATATLRAWGVRDASNGRVLLWIDNAADTWKNAVDGVAVPAASGRLTIPGLPAGDYNVEWWDTVAGSVSATQALTVASDGQLSLTVTNLLSDVAVKLGRTSAPAQTPSPTKTATPRPTATSRPSPEGCWYMAGANPQRTSRVSEEVRGALSPAWYRPIEAYIPPKVQLITANGLVYVATSKGLYALDASSGEIAWVYPTDMPLGNSPTVLHGVLYVGGFDHKVHALNALPDLAALPVDSATGYRLNNQVLWTFTAGAGFDTNPLVVHDTVFLGNRDGWFYALEASSGALKWKYQTNGPIHFSAAYQEGVIYFASDDAYAYALHEANGALLWKSARLPSWGFHSWWPTIVGNVALFPAARGYRMFVPPQTNYASLQLTKYEDGYWTEGGGEADMGPLLGDGTMNASRALQYFEQKPWRRSF